jgi:uncharacterized protein
MTAEQDIDYEALAQNAMRGVVRAVLGRVAKSGLPGEHHFYIAFNTQAPGVVISKRLKEKYPEEMTIVLQHRFWDLTVTDDRFEVKLTFDAIPERLNIPFSAIKVFFDPSVPYGLQFEDSELTGDKQRSASNADASDFGTRDPRLPDVGQPATRGARADSRTPSRLATERTDKKRLPSRAKSDKGTETVPSKSVKPVEARPKVNVPAPTPTPTPVTPANEEKPAPGGGAKIVSLDQFRKK